MISFRNTEPLPNDASELPAYYSQGGYTIPTSASASSTTTSVVSPTASSTVGLPTLQTLITPPSISNNNTQHSTSSPLSSGGKAGIGVGAAISAVAIGVVLFLLLRNYRRRRTQQPAFEDMRQGDGVASEPAEMAGHEPTKVYEKPEMHGEAMKLEMDGEPTQKSSVHELAER